MKIIEIETTRDMLASAALKSIRTGKLNGSYTEGYANMHAFIGEELALEVLKGERQPDKNYDFDQDVGGIKVDSKAKKTSVVPQNHYNCSVPKDQKKQKCDYYAFTRINSDFKKGWFLGTIPKEKFFDLASFAYKDTPDPADPRHLFLCDSYYMEISKLEICQGMSDYMKSNGRILTI